MKCIYSAFNFVVSALGCFAASLGLASESSNPGKDPLPAIIVETSPHHFAAKQRVKVSMTLISSNSTQQSRAEMSVRGSSSAKHPKKPYRLELQDESGDDLKLSLLGMPKESDWILYPAYLDKTIIRDVLAYELWRQMGYCASIRVFRGQSSSLPSVKQIPHSALAPPPCSPCYLACDYLANSPLVSQITYRSNTTTRMTTTKKHDFRDRLVDITSVPSASSAVKFGYQCNDADQRTRRIDSDDSYWSYEYDSLGQVTSGKHYWSDATPIAGQQFEYAYDDIGNRRRTKEGGDAAGLGLRTANYSVNNLNQYTQRETKSPTRSNENSAKLQPILSARSAPTVVTLGAKTLKTACVHVQGAFAPVG